MFPIRLFLVLVWFFSASQLLAQTAPPLDRLISVDIRNETIENALRQISRAGRFEFSYNPTRIDAKAVVSVRLTNVPVRDVLHRLFADRVIYKSRGNHVILLPGNPPNPTPKNFLLDGYILDEQTGERIAQASIFEKTTLASTVSNPFGYYRLRLPTNLPAVRLDVRKQSYLGETVIVRSRQTHSVSIRLTPQSLPLSLVQPLPVRVTEDTIRPTGSLAVVSAEPPVMADDTTASRSAPSLPERGLAGVSRLFVSAQQTIHDINLSRDTLYRDWQVSFLPFMGTNHRLSGRISNRFSVNMLVGYSFGVRAFELGGLMNIVRTDVHGFQAGGLANVVGGQVTGVQVGGLLNYTGQQVQGVQVSGLVNIAGQAVNGVQIGGLTNYTSHEVEGAQIAGLVNVSSRSVKGIQLAGLVNYTNKDVHGWQIAGIVNRARIVKNGSQIGLINVADSSKSVPIGLISVVRKGGYQRFEVATNEVNLLNITLRTGVRSFYNIITAGNSFEREGSPRLSVGYGLGTAFSLSRSTLFALEGTYHHLFYFNGLSLRPPFSDGWNSQIRLSTLVEIGLSRHLSLAFGPSANWYFSTDGTDRPLLQPAIPLLSDRVDVVSNARHWGWIGFQIGLRYGNL
jgi:hypothetical protein